MSLGKRLRTVRGDFTQSGFAAKLGVIQPTVRNYEQENRRPDFDFLNFICYNFDISPEWLLMGTGPMNKEKSPTRRTNLDAEKSQHTKIIKTEISKSSDVSDGSAIQRDLMDSYRNTAALQRELTDTTRENGDLRVEIERRNGRIRELEREVEALRKAMKPAAVPDVDWQGVA